MSNRIESLLDSIMNGDGGNLSPETMRLLQEKPEDDASEVAQDLRSGKVSLDDPEDVARYIRDRLGPKEAAKLADLLVPDMQDVVAQQYEKHRFSCVMANLPEEDAELVRQISDMIDEGDLADDGIPESPHVTVRYGLHTTDASKVSRMLKTICKHGGIEKVEFTLGDFGLFRNPDADVLHIKVEGHILGKLHRGLGRLPNTVTHEEYNPHVTVAYLAPGEGPRVMKEVENLCKGRKVKVDSLRFSPSEGDDAVLPLDGEKQDKEETLMRFMKTIMDRLDSIEKKQDEKPEPQAKRRVVERNPEGLITSIREE